MSQALINAAEKYLAIMRDDKGQISLENAEYLRSVFDEALQKPQNEIVLEGSLRTLQAIIHQDNVKAGWWNNLDGTPMTENEKFLLIGWKLALVHSEVSEATEGIRKNLMDDKLPHRKMGEVECADAIIRILDMAEALGYDVAGALFEKRAYNAQRADHKPENRQNAGGKKF